MTDSPRPRAGRSLLILLIGALVGALLTLLVPGPRAPEPVVGDAAFAAEVVDAIGDTGGMDTVSAARIRNGETTWAGLGETTPDSRYELGSITKTFNGLLLADAVERGEVTLDQPLETIFTELAGTPAGSVTLEELASHRSGLPAMGAMNYGEVILEDLAGHALSAYTRSTLADLVAAARTSQLPGRGEFAYSNLGAALLGHALARATGAEDWAALVQDRLLDPLGMADTRIDLASPAPDVLQPHQANGRVNEPWNGAGYAPAGLGVTTTADDLVRYATAILDGTAPGLDALGERWPTNMGELRVGLAWMDAGGITWHNGGTGGTRTMLAIDREAGAAAIVLTNTEHDVTGAGLVLLGADAAALPGPPPIDPDTIGWVVAGLLAVGLFGWGAVRSRSRVRLIGQGLGAVGSLLIWGIAAPWYWAPLRLFGLVVGLTIASIIVAVRRWRELPWWPERRRWAAATLAIAGVLWFVFTVAVSIWVLVLLLG